ncbi:phage tail assembly protein [Nocardiopsis aegyptia]|uniref:phage tail assembly protein n=1 Tax=Nocardiopsis aegyptia TaxID=220378 RepID=UPI00366B1CE0
MSTIDVSDLQGSAPEPTVVKLKGRSITLQPLLEVGAEHDDTLLELIDQIGQLNKAKAEAGDGESLEQVRAMMPMANKILTMAAPTKKDGEALLKLPLAARFKVLMGYVEDQDLGEALPSES